MGEIEASAVAGLSNEFEIALEIVDHRRIQRIEPTTCRSASETANRRWCGGAFRETSNCGEVEGPEDLRRAG